MQPTIKAAPCDSETLARIYELEDREFGVKRFSRRKIFRLFTHQAYARNVVVINNQIGGFIVYRLRPDHFELERICVDAYHQTMGYGRLLWESMTKRLGGSFKYIRVNTDNPIDSSDAVAFQDFLRHMGCRAHRFHKDHSLIDFRYPK